MEQLERIFPLIVKRRDLAVDNRALAQGIAIVRCVEGTDAGYQLVKQGLAWAYEHHLPEAPAEAQQSYTAAEAAARDERIGLWLDSNPVPPWEYRKIQREQRAQVPSG